MSTKSKKAATSAASASRPTLTTTLSNAATTTQPTTAAASLTSSSSPTSAPAAAASPQAASEQRCYCSDPRPLQSDLICSHNSSDCYATHVSCLRDNDGNPFTDYVLGRSCFLCAHCVNRRGFRHPAEMECTLDSRHGCFYEKKGFTKQREAERPDTTTAIAAAVVEGKNGVVGGGEMKDDREKVESKEEMESEEKDKADDTRMEDEEVERITNGHATHSNRRSTRTSADRDGTSTASAAVSNNTTSTSTWPAASSSNSAVASSSSAAAESAVGVDDEPLEPKKAKRRGIREADKKARAKLVPRCTSPSHFLIDDPAALASASSAFPTAASSSSAALALAPSSAASLPSTSASSRHIDKLRTDALLSSISSMYYRPRLVHPSAADVYVSADYDRFEYPTADALLSPLRKASVLDEWAPLEVALFESGICSYGKDFHAISRLMGGRKTCGQCVEFYYVWKKSGHYAMWKEYGKPVRRRTDSKAEQWRAVEDRMRGFSGRHDEDAGKRKRAEEAEEARERERMGENGSQDKKAKSEGAGSQQQQQQQSSTVKMEEDSGVSSGGMKVERPVAAASSVSVS